MTLTSITGTECSVPQFPWRPPSVRQWWRCGTAPGKATRPRYTWNHGRGPSATRAPPSSTRNMPRTLTAPRSTTMLPAPAAGLCPRCSWSRARTQVPVSSTQRICRATLYFYFGDKELKKVSVKREILLDPIQTLYCPWRKPWRAFSDILPEIVLSFKEERLVF